MIGERSLYTKQLLRNYKQRNSANVYVVNYRFANDDKERYRLFGHNEGIDFAIQYIKDRSYQCHASDHSTFSYMEFYNDGLRKIA